MKLLAAKLKGISTINFAGPKSRHKQIWIMNHSQCEPTATVSSHNFSF
jgi:hypothetical protein